MAEFRLRETPQGTVIIESRENGERQWRFSRDGVYAKRYSAEGPWFAVGFSELPKHVQMLIGDNSPPVSEERQALDDWERATGLKSGY